VRRKITTYHQACHVAAPETAHGFDVVAVESFDCAEDFALVAAEIVVAAAQTVADFAVEIVEIVVAVVGAAHAIGPLVHEILIKHINE